MNDATSSAVCPYCREAIAAGSDRCPHCEERLGYGRARYRLAQIVSGFAFGLFVVALSERLFIGPTSAFESAERTRMFLEKSVAAAFLLLAAGYLRRR